MLYDHIMNLNWAQCLQQQQQQQQHLIMSVPYRALPGMSSLAGTKPIMHPAANELVICWALVNVFKLQDVCIHGSIFQAMLGAMLPYLGWGQESVLVCFGMSMLLCPVQWH